MSAEQIATTIKALEAALNLETDDIKKLIADGNAIIAKRQQASPPSKRGRPRRKEVIQQG